ncbi:hypothetical protein EVA_07745 [gut metagenome]|uniref:Uncharacterized protein n=1 Tax=gut metagenome TaxID=749906 RepID=J9GBC5_9ZZZZ
MAVRLCTQRAIVSPDPASTQSEQRSLATHFPLIHTSSKATVVQITLIFAYLRT